MTPLSNSIRYSTQWTHTDRSNATQLIPPLSDRKHTTVDREPVWQPCLDEVVHREGLTECHLHVRKSPPSVKLATDLGEYRTVLSFYSFFFFTQDITLMIS